MWPIILIGAAVFLLLIVVSICAYPVVCAIIVMACKKYQTIVTSMVLLFTMALYLFACYALENALDNWCYSLYAGIVSTPACLFWCIGVDALSDWSESETLQYNKLTIPLLTFLTSTIFALEGLLRITNVCSMHWLSLNRLSSIYSKDLYGYYDGFEYAGFLLLTASIVSMAFIAVHFISTLNSRKKILKKEKQAQKFKDEIIQKVKDDYDSLLTSDPSGEESLIQLYSDFCQTFCTALQASDENSQLFVDYESFNDIKVSYKVLKLTSKNRIYFIYPVGIVVKYLKSVHYEYIRFEKSTLSMFTERRTIYQALPGDIKPLLQTWRVTRQDGRPDLRYKDNSPRYVYMFGVIHINKVLYLHTPYVKHAKSVELAFNVMCSQMTILKVQNQEEKKPVLQDTSPQQISNEKTKPSTNITTWAEEAQDISIDCPHTLEECFCALVNKRGFEIFSKESLAAIISTQYKETDISEYKEIIEQMVRNDYFSQFADLGKQNDFTVYNVSGSFGRTHKLNTAKCLFVTQSFVSAIKKYNSSKK